MRRKQHWAWWGVSGAAVVVTTMVCIDVARGWATRREPTPAEMRQALPADIISPKTAAVKLVGRDLDAFRKRPPLTVGRPGPRLEALDFRKDRVSIPTTNGRPTICVVSCGCIECGGFLHDLVRLREEAGPKFQLAAFVATRSDYAWGHHAGTFGMRESIRMIRDDGRFLRTMRPPGEDPDEITRLPLVWVSDGKGIVRYVEQPQPDGPWLARVRKAAGL